MTDFPPLSPVPPPVRSRATPSRTPEGCCREKDARIAAALAVLEDAEGGSLPERHKVAAMILKVALRRAEP